MIKKSLILSSAGLKNITPNINNEENEFLFIQMSMINADSMHEINYKSS